MQKKCKLCFTPDTEWAADDLESHITREHGDQEPSVRAMYDSRFEHLFDGSESPTAETPDSPPRGGHSSPQPGEEMFGKKWFMIGIGGAGNNILDAILMRRDTLAGDDDNRANLWQKGLAGYGILNTNLREMEKTYYATEEKQYDRRDLLSNSIIGMGVHDNTGMGHRWQNGMKVAAADFEEDPDPFTARWDLSKQAMKGSQAIMLIHSVTKGTGCGSTPVIAEQIRESVLPEDMLIDKPIFSSVVIPSEGAGSTVGSRAKTNGVVGLARVAQTVDAIIPFNNRLLREAHRDITPRIDNLQQYNPPQFVDLNKPLVSFLEAFTMSSIPMPADQSASIQGSVFDVADSFRPVEDKYPASVSRADRPGVVLGPALGRLRDSGITASKLEVLVLNTRQNVLADFDPSTAWGGNFMLYGPESKMEQISQFVENGTLKQLLLGPAFLDVDDSSGAEAVDIQINQLVSPYLDDVYMWAMLWNPELRALSTMYDHAKTLKTQGSTEQASDIRAVWDKVELLFDHLGREQMK